MFIDPDFLKYAQNFGDLSTLADIGLLNICMGFQDLLTSNGGFGVELIAGWCDIDPPTNSFFSGGGSYVCANFGENRQTDRLTDANRFFTALHWRSSREKGVSPSVRPSVCSSVKPVDCDKTEEKYVKIFIPYERSFSLVFWEKEWLVGGDFSSCWWPY